MRKKGLFLIPLLLSLGMALLLFLDERADLTHVLWGGIPTPFNQVEVILEVSVALFIGISGAVAIFLYSRWCDIKQQSYDERLYQLRKVLDKSPILTVIMDRQGVISYANDAFLFHMGLTLAEILDRQVIDFLPIEDAAYLEGKLPDLVCGVVNRIDLETVLVTAHQKKVNLKAILTLLDPGSKGHQDILIFAEDLTDRRSLEARARGIPAIEELERITRDMAHEYNNKLMTILGASALIADHSTDPEIDRLVDEVRRTAEQSIDLTRRLAAFSGRKERSPLPIKLNRLVGSLLPILRSSLPGSIKIKSLLGESDPLIHCRTALIQNALLNLAFNARDAMDSDGEITISTSVRILTSPMKTFTGDLPPGEYAVISLADTGHGFDPAEIPQLFQPFYTTRKGAAGLGLSSVSGAVMAHRGAVEVVSDKGKGAVFSLVLPVRPAENVQQVRYTADEVRGSGRILLVDDEEILRSIMARMITGLGYQVAEAPSGADALALWDDSGPFDAILLDMVMPGMDGVMAAGEFLKRDPGARIMLLTGYQVEEKGEEFLRAGITLAAGKPISRRELAAKLAYLIHGETET